MNISKIKEKIFKPRKTILFKHSAKFVRNHAKSPVVRLISFILLVVMGFFSINYTGFIEDKTRVNSLAGKYIYHVAQTTSVEAFRQDLTDEESQKDFDGDGIINVDEIMKNLDIYCTDTDYDGIYDKTALEYGELSGFSKFESVYDELFPSTNFNLLTFSNKDYDVQVRLDESKSVSEYGLRYYSGRAFDGIEKLTMPIVFEKYNSYAYFSSEKLLEKVNKIRKMENCDDYRIVVLSYDIKNDEYVVLSENSIYSYDEYTEFEIYVSNVKPKNPIIVTVCQIRNDEDDYIDPQYDIFGNLSLKYTILSNRIKNNKYTVAFGEEGTGELTLFTNYNSMNTTLDEDLIESCCKDSFKLLTSGMYEDIKRVYELQNETYEDSTEPIEVTEVTEAVDENEPFDNIRENHFKYSYIGEVKGNEILNFISENYGYEKTKTKSYGYSETHKANFNITKNAFAFANYSDSEAKNGVGIAMAELASNYYNFKSFPKVEGCEAGFEKLKKNGFVSQDYCQYANLFKDYSTLKLVDEDIDKMLKNVNESIVSNTYYNSRDTHSRATGVLSELTKQIDSGKTVVAYMRNGNDMTAVVVYLITRDAISPSEYTLYVYDPNFPINRISVLNEETGELEEIKWSNTIKIKTHSYMAITPDEKGVANRANFTFEYGNTINYYFGNSGDYHDGLLYTGGDICFKVPTDLSKDTTVKFMGEANK